MDKLKSSIEEANQAVDRERQKNVSLLHLIFPPDIAKRLWLGQYSPLNLHLTGKELLYTTFSPSHK
jgi:guanylate cyclase soluble subunit alpha